MRVLNPENKLNDYIVNLETKVRALNDIAEYSTLNQNLN